MSFINLGSFGRGKPLRLLIAGVVLLVIAGGLWGYHTYRDPERVFKRMLSQSLSTSGVTIQTTQNNGGATITQTVQYALGAKNISHSWTTIKQDKTRVVTETIGASGVDFTRYAAIKTDRKGQNGKPLNVSKLVGVWAKNAPGQLFTQAALGTGMPLGGIAVPIANLTPSLRGQLIDQIMSDNVYQTDYSTAKKQKVDHRLQYSYNVKIQPVAYAKLMKAFAKDLGLHELDTINPADFATQQALELTITVDVKSGHVVAASLPKGQYEQKYHSYDIPVSVTLPSQTITAAELQKRLSEVR